MQGREDHDELVGRGSERAALAAALDRVDGGEPGFLVVAGEAGIGKTRLLDELAVAAGERGHAVFSGRASELEREIAFAVFISALDDYLESLNPRLLERLGPERLADLATIFPSLRELAPGAGDGRPEERYRAHRAAVALLERLTARRPLSLILDDVHWADEGSQELLAHLLRHGIHGPCLVAIAARPAQTPDLLRRALELAGRDRAIRRLDLGPLGPEEARALLGDGLDAEAAETLYAESGGNPLFLEQLRRWGRVRDIAGRSAARRPEPGGAPEGVLAAIEDEIRALDQATVAALRGAAIAGDPFELDLAAAAAAIPKAEAIAAIDDLLDLALARPTDVPTQFRFRHPIIRRAIYDSAGPAWRIAAHARCAAALAERGATAGARAHHVERSATGGDAETIAVLSAAGDEVSAQAPGTAAHWFEAALRLLGDDAPPGRRVELLIRLARARAAAGRIAEGRDAALDALALMPDRGGEERAALTATCAALETLLGLHDDAHDRLTVELEALPERASKAGAATLLALAVNNSFRSDFTGCRDRAREALAVAAQVGDRDQRISARSVLALGELYLGRVSESRAALDEAEAELRADPVARCSFEAMHWLGWAQAYNERFELAAETFAATLELSRESGRGELLVPTRAALAQVRVGLGKLGEAEEAAEAALDAARLSGNRMALLWGICTRTWVARWRGDLGLALSTAAEGEALAAELEATVIAAAGGWIFGAARLEAGDPEGCIRVILELAGSADAPRIDAQHECLRAELLVRAELARGRIDEAAEWAARAAAIAPGLDLELPVAQAQRAQATVALATGEPERAARLARSAIAGAERVGSRLEAAVSRLLAGRALAAAGEQTAAVADLEHSHRELASFGAAHERDQAARELRMLGRSIGRPKRQGQAATGPQALSGREQEVAALVAAGRTNDEIAATLFVSPKTVEKHVSRVLAKLAVKRRAGVAAALAADPEAPRVYS